jgi:hypothetical protein
VFCRSLFVNARHHPEQWRLHNGGGNKHHIMDSKGNSATKAATTTTSCENQLRHPTTPKINTTQ